MQTETVGPQIHCCKHCLPLSKRTFDKTCTAIIRRPAKCKLRQ
ncbi:hypothetical protein CPter291_3036 [Collimonas pratensis]|uniref:Uncharacterized protein n=1 Tax=Collimonas pratensis TaxID=279113 RepID=A0ABM5Z8Q8_9BURK|nr:hypothetical protein CPter291_3036 [Collimonas pratensis]